MKMMKYMLTVYKYSAAMFNTAATNATTLLQACKMVLFNIFFAEF